VLFSDLEPEEAANFAYQAPRRGPRPAEPIRDPRLGPDTSWWEGPLDRVMNRQVDGKQTYTDATKMSLEQVAGLAGQR